MTNNEAIKILQDTPIDVASTKQGILGLYAEALNMAIEALSNNNNQTNSELKTTTGDVSATDVIYRQDAIDAAIKADMENHNGILSEKRARVFEEHIAILPSAHPEIIRCKDCEYYMPQQESTGLCTWFSDVLKYGVSVIDFCSNGKKAGDSDDES